MFVWLARREDDEGRRRKTGKTDPHGVVFYNEDIAWTRAHRISIDSSCRAFEVDVVVVRYQCDQVHISPLPDRVYVSTTYLAVVYDV